LGKVIKVTDDVYEALDAIKREKGLRSPNAAIKKLLEGKIEKVTISEPKPESRVSWEKGESNQAIKRQLIELRAMVQKLLDLVGSQKEPQSPEPLQAPENLDKCPYCGFKLQGNKVRVELLNVHLPLPRIGIEFNYLACPACEKPLTKITWKPIKT